DLFFDNPRRAPQRHASAAFSTPRRLTNSMASDGYPKVSPDGTKIVFTSDGTGTIDLFLMKLDGSSPRNLTANSVREAGPAWSPNGRRLVFGIETIPLRESDIWVMDAEGGEPVNLTNAPGFDARPAFSPDGTRIAFASNRGTGSVYNFDLWVMNA